jgi:hypothetical protein
VLTANIAAFFVERTQEETTRQPVVAKLDKVLERLAVLEERLGASEAGSLNPRCCPPTLPGSAPRGSAKFTTLARLTLLAAFDHPT